MHTKKKRAITGTIAIVAALLLIVGGTFAYTLFEHKSNFAKSNAKYIARLVENFENTSEWKVGSTLTKEVSVENMGNTSQFPGKGWGDIYVRIQLKEFMDIKTIGYEYYYKGYDASAPATGEKAYLRFMIDRHGNFVRFPVAAGISKEEAVTAFISTPSNWTDVIDDTNVATSDFLKSLSPEDFVAVQGLFDDTPYYYLKTRAEFPNGQYGAGLVMKEVVGNNTITVSGMEGITVADADYESYYSSNAWHDKTAECDYPVHLWHSDDPQCCDFGTHDYVQWSMNPDHYIFYSDWAKNPQPIKKWILDPATGWAYWGAAIPEYDSSNPNANITSTLIDSIKLIQNPGGALRYLLHVDMEAADIFEMPEDWLISTFKARTSLSFQTDTISANLSKETTKPSPDIKNKDASDIIRFSISDANVAQIDPDTGVLTLIGPGTAIVTAEVINGPHKGQTFTYILQVTEDTEQPLTFNTATISKNVSDSPFQSPPVSGYDPSKYSLENWKSSDNSVVTVDSNGEVTITGSGTASVSVTVVPKNGGSPYEISYDVSVAGPGAIGLNIPSGSYDPNDGFSTEINLSDDDKNFALKVIINGNFVDVYHAASIPLEEIVTGTSDFTGFYVQAKDSQFQGLITTGAMSGEKYFDIKNDTRRSGKPSLFFNWYPTSMSEYLAIRDTWRGPDTFGRTAPALEGSTPVITTTVRLACDTPFGSIYSDWFKITVHYTQSMLAY
jgi:hypothetical protein